MSALALKLIAENKKSKATRLDLGNCGLTDFRIRFPKSFTHLFFRKMSHF